MIRVKPLNFLLAFILLISTSAGPKAKAKEPLKNKKVLLYTKNGKGFVHDNIPSAIKAIEKLGKEHEFIVEVSEDPQVFSKENLQKYTLLIFASTNNDVFDTDEQRLSFRQYIQAGGGFVGIHSITGTERNWTWFKQMVGGTFSWHAPAQVFKAQVIRPDHPTMKGLPLVWERSDEMYFTKEMYPGIQVLIAHDVSSLDNRDADLVAEHSKHFGNLYPAAWHQKFDGGTIWITTYGHEKESYQDPVYLAHLFQGIQFVAEQSQELNYEKAYARHRDQAVRY